MKNNLTFTKMTGAGNDFVIIDAREKDFPKFDRVMFTKAICRRNFGVGADGVVFLEKTKTPHVAFKWDFYNADGSVAEACGNASRCVARFAFENEIADRNVDFETLAGIIKTRVGAKGFVEVEMATPQLIQKQMDVPVGEHIRIPVTYINTGVPHVVRENDDWSDEYLNDMGEYLRNHVLFKGTNGANATFFEVMETGKLQAVTYERGVEGLTLACGTGAVAAAAAHVLLHGAKAPIEVNMPGGQLHVQIDADLKKATLGGEARFICEGTLSPEALL